MAFFSSELERRPCLAPNTPADQSAFGSLSTAGRKMKWLVTLGKSCTPVSKPIIGMLSAMET